jgi:FtsP/CotA-like multicopper oxidase with cupredoxin domain
MTALSMFNVWIDDHQMEIVEIDGVDVEPFVVDCFSISAAQRYSHLRFTISLFGNCNFDHSLLQCYNI